MIDGEGNGYKSPSYPALPHYRVQAGIAAVILDPVPGDIGVFSCTKRDSTNVSVTSNDQQIPASMRSFSPSDAIMVGTVHTKDPTTWIHLKQDNTIVIHAPSGVKIESDTSVEITAPQVTVNATTVTVNATESTFSGHVTVLGGITVSGGGGSQMTGDFTLNGSMNATDDVTASGISLNSHVHGGIQPGGSDTSTPK
jgi:phage baseplate assembly protein gpV